MICNAKPKGLFSAPFGLCIIVFALAPNQIGRQDVAALIARQPVVAAHWRQHIRASAFGTIHAATFSFSRPIGTAVPQPLSYRLASLDPRMITLGPWNLQPDLDDPPLPFPKVDRSAKGDRQPVLHPPQREPETAKTPEEVPAVAAIPSEPVAVPAEAEPVESVAVDTAAAENEQPAAALPEDEPGPAPEAEAIPEATEAAENPGANGDRQPVLHPPQRETAETPEEVPAMAAIPSEPVAAPAEAEPVESVAVDTAAAENEQPSAALPEDEPGPALEAEAIPEASEAAENPGEDIPDPVDTVVAEADDLTSAEPVEPLMEMARLYFGNEPLGDAPGAIEKWAPGEEPTIIAPTPPADPDIKQSALDPKPAPPESKGGESIAPKGEVTGEGKRPITPAERLKLEGQARIKAEKCLADAVYFEARGEAIRGQIAVAQVVMNRVFSGYYPRSVCGAVYQNAHRRLACQFTFACDGIPESITEPHAWSRATRIARDVLDGKFWLPEVNRATHYHAYWVRPRWVREMKRLYKTGVHTFYRPRRWGDGGDMPSWGTAEATSEAIAKL